MSLCLSSTQLWLSYSLRLPVSGSKGLNGHLTNSIQSKWNCCLVRELSKSERWDYPGRWWVKLSKKKSNSATGFQPTHTLPILLYTSPGTSCLQISKAHRLSLRESECVQFVLSATVSLWMLIWLCLLLFMIVAVNAFPGGCVCVRLFASACQSEKVIPLTGTTDGEGVDLLVLSATWEPRGYTEAMPDAQSADRGCFVLI